MARSLQSRYRVSATAEVLTPLTVGGAAASGPVDIVLARDGMGSHYIPGTSIAGPLRAWCAARFDPSLVDLVWGYQQDDEGAASLLTIENAPVEISGDVPEIWHGVGIDRFSGSARPGFLYTREVLPRGTTIGLSMICDVPRRSSGNVVGMLSQILEALKSGLRFGSAKTRGHGLVALQSETLSIVEEDWSGSAGVAQVLAGNSPNIGLEDLPYIEPETSPDIHDVEVVWKPFDQVMVAAGYDGLAVDVLPMTSGVDADHVAFVMPGSSIKGALRSKAEQIVRTLLGPSHERVLDSAEDEFLDQIDVPLVDELFGSALDDDESGKAGALTVDTCYSRERIERRAWDDIVLEPDVASLSRKLDSTGLDIDCAYHVKIDRWTGGAYETALYSALEPRVNWEPIRFVFDRSRLSEDEKTGVTVLLALVIRELAEGRIPLGFGVNRGYGTVEVESLNGSVPGVEIEPTPEGSWLLRCTDDALEGGWARTLASLREDAPAGARQT